MKYCHYMYLSPFLLLWEDVIRLLLLSSITIVKAGLFPVMEHFHNVILALLLR